MKAIYKCFLFLCLGAMTGGCDDFLERSAQDLVIPTTTAHYKEMLQGEGYFQKIGKSYLPFILMTDDAVYFDASTMTDREWNGYDDNNVATYQDIYSWAGEIENDSYTDECFLYLYSQVMVANVCLQAVDGTEGTDEEKAILRGQAAFTRAFAYLMLANIYAKPYSEAAPDDLCVPIKLNPTPNTDLYTRATMREVWELITTDIRTALDCLKDKDIPNLYEINYKAALVLATRIALYMEDYANVLKYGQEFLSLHDRLYDITDKKASIANQDQNADDKVVNFNGIGNPEIVFLFGEYLGNNYKTLFFSIDCRFYTVADTVIRLYDYDTETQEGDHRLPYWFMPPSAPSSSTYAVYPCSRYRYVPLKYDNNDRDYRAQFSLRTGEVYLSLAEAYARQEQPDAGKAIDYLNGLREKRIAPYIRLTKSDFATNEQLVEFIWQERRRELCFEELHRWWDLRREGRPQLEHPWKGKAKYLLEKEDPAYVLNFPIAEREYNPELLPNSRPIRKEGY